MGSYQDLSVFSEPYHPSNAMEGENCCYTPPVGIPISNDIKQNRGMQLVLHSRIRLQIWVNLGDFGNGPAPSQCTWMTDTLVQFFNVLEMSKFP